MSDLVLRGARIVDVDGETVSPPLDVAITGRTISGIGSGLARASIVD